MPRSIRTQSLLPAPAIVSSLIVVAFSSWFSSAASAATPEEPINISVDSGHLIVEWAELTVPYELTATVPATCAGTKLTFERTATKFTVHHIGAPCRDKTLFKIRLSKSRSANVHLASGVIETPNLGTALASMQQLHATVDAGRVASSLTSLVPVPSHDYYSMAVNWAGGPAGGIVIDLDTKAGTIDL